MQLGRVPCVVEIFSKDCNLFNLYFSKCKKKSPDEPPSLRFSSSWEAESDSDKVESVTSNFKMFGSSRTTP